MGYTSVCRGVSLDEIYGLSKIIDLDKLGKQWGWGVGTGIGQGSNNTSMNSSDDNGSSKANEFNLEHKLRGG